jgi:hypothetical protein
VTVDVVREMVGADVLDYRLAEIGDRPKNPLEARGGQAAEDRPEAILLDRLDLVPDPRTLLGRSDEDHTTIVRNADAVDEAALRHPIDKTRRVAQRHIEQVGEATHRDVAVMLENPQNVEVGHADAGLDHSPGSRAAKAADHLVELRSDLVDELDT